MMVIFIPAVICDLKCRGRSESKVALSQVVLKKKKKQNNPPTRNFNFLFRSVNWLQLWRHAWWFACSFFSRKHWISDKLRDRTTIPDEASLFCVVPLLSWKAPLSKNTCYLATRRPLFPTNWQDLYSALVRSLHFTK